jgi:phosphohistidine phosphatase
MKRVYLLRHAKSSWKQRGVPDHDRPLAPRGRRAAKAIAGHLLEQGIEPELVLCSTAQRARETFERIEPVLGTPVVRFEPELYGASAGVLLDRLHGVGNAVGSVLLIGHNPAVQLLALDLARPAPESRAVEAKFPTAGLATLVFPGSNWRAVAPDTAELTEFVRPRDLER